MTQVSDGPSGARGEIFGENVPAAFLPSGVSMGATWDEDLMYEIGQLLGNEVLLRPCQLDFGVCKVESVDSSSVGPSRLR